MITISLLTMASSDILQIKFNNWWRKGVLKDWCRIWRMQLSLPKTEITLFSKSNTENQEPVVIYDNHVLQYNQNPKLFGVHLYEKLNFRKHIEVSSHKASRCLGVFEKSMESLNC